MRDLALAAEADTESLGALVARWALEHAHTVRIHLDGDLGAGKTTLVRGALGALGHAGPVRSPTYTLVEPYTLSGRCVLHMDLYRIADPEELELLGLRDAEAESALWWVEWPQRGVGWLPEADLLVRLSMRGKGRSARLEGSDAALARIASQVPGKWLES